MPWSAAAARAVVTVAVAASAFVAATGVGSVWKDWREVTPAERAERALPFDAPIPSGLELEHAGAGEDLAYRLEYGSSLAPAALAKQFEDDLARSPKWRITYTDNVAGGTELTLARAGSDGYLTHFAIARIESAGREGSAFRFDFLPMWELGEAR